MNVRIYVEGGGRGQASARCKEAFRSFFARALEGCAKPTIVACGSRERAYDMFKKAWSDHSDNLVLLLVDSEDGVSPGADAWQHLAAHDGWQAPPGATDVHAHLMVRCMETWLLADRARLQSFYGTGFQASALPATARLEDVSKGDAYASLRLAARPTVKGPYDKVRHGFELLAAVDPHRVETASPTCAKLLALLRVYLCGEFGAALA